MSPNKLDHYLREIFQDKDNTLELARRFIEQTIKEAEQESVKNDAPGDRYAEYLTYALNTLIPHNIDQVFAYAESAIEKIFLNSLILCFVKADPLDLTIRPPTPDAISWMKQYRKYHNDVVNGWKRFQKWFTKEHPNADQDAIRKAFEEYLDSVVNAGELTELQRNGIICELLLGHEMQYFNSFELILQPGFPQIKIDGKSIRPDLLIWVPGNKKFNLVVECDGFEHHSEKRSFISDRKRDRALMVSGFTVQRYSGSEIFNDPVGASRSLFDYLMANRKIKRKRSEY